LQLAWVEICYWIQDIATIDKVMKHIESPIERYGTVSQKLLYRSHLISGALVAEHFRLNQSHVSISRETMLLAIESGDPYQIAKARRQLGIVEMFAGQFDAAEKSFREAISLCEKNNDMNSMLIARAYLLFTHRYQLKSNEVSADADVLEKLLEQVSDNPAYRGLVYANRAWLAWLNGDYDQTKQLAVTAINLWNSQRNPYIAFWLALFPLLATIIAEKKIDETKPIIQAMLAPLQMRLAPEIESALQAVLEVDPSDEERILHLGRHAVDIAKQAGYT
jgi:tetratricopeptide (TPR) repeat protein